MPNRTSTFDISICRIGKPPASRQDPHRSAPRRRPRTRPQPRRWRRTSVSRIAFGDSGSRTHRNEADAVRRRDGRRRGECLARGVEYRLDRRLALEQPLRRKGADAHIDNSGRRRRVGDADQHRQRRRSNTVKRGPNAGLNVRTVQQRGPKAPAGPAAIPATIVDLPAKAADKKTMAASAAIEYTKGLQPSCSIARRPCSSPTHRDPGPVCGCQHNDLRLCNRAATDSYCQDHSRMTSPSRFCGPAFAVCSRVCGACQPNDADSSLQIFRASREIVPRFAICELG